MEGKKYIVVRMNCRLGFTLVNRLTFLGQQVYHFAPREGPWTDKKRVTPHPLDVSSWEITTAGNIESANTL